MGKSNSKKNFLNKERAERLINKVFENSKIVSYSELKGGLVHSTFKVKIFNPKKTLVVRLSKRKDIPQVTKNNLVLDYLNKHKILVPKVYLQQLYHGQLITLMEFLQGKDAAKAYKKTNQGKREIILKDAGKILFKIHKLKIPEFWVHQKHEIKNKKEWIDWIKLRIAKYLLFVNDYLPQYSEYLDKELKEFQDILIARKNKLYFVPLHGDYHLANITVNSEGKVTGVFDFDLCMKGDNLADLGQTKYWIWFKMNDVKNFKYFLNGYKNNFTKDELKIIQGYFLLHLIAVTRTIWRKQPRLTWIIKKHKKILDYLISAKKY